MEGTNEREEQEKKLNMLNITLEKKECERDEIQEEIDVIRDELGEDLEPECI